MGVTKKLIIAHRGASADARENTIESFEKAMALGADMIEFDVRRTRDDVLIVFHDEWIQGKPLGDLTFQDISQIALEQGFHLPTVEEVLKWSRGKIKLDVELKEEGYENEIMALLWRYLKEDEFVVTSFHEFSLKIIKDRYPLSQIGLLLGGRKEPLWERMSAFSPAKRCHRAKADFLAVHWKLLWFGFLERARRHHIPLFIWTVNDEKMIRTLLHDRSVDALITDRLELAVSLQRKIAS